MIKYLIALACTCCICGDLVASGCVTVHDNGTYTVDASYKD